VVKGDVRCCIVKKKIKIKRFKVKIFGGALIMDKLPNDYYYGLHL